MGIYLHSHQHPTTKYLVLRRLKVIDRKGYQHPTTKYLVLRQFHVIAYKKLTLYYSYLILRLLYHPDKVIDAPASKKLAVAFKKYLILRRDIITRTYNEIPPYKA